MTTHTLQGDGVALVYDVHGPLPTADGRPPLVLIGQPMDASGFRALVARMPERTTVTYDPRGIGRSVRSDGRVDADPRVQAEDVHRLIAEVGGPVDLFASSGGAVTALALVAAHPDDVRTLVAHEPPLVRLLPDADVVVRAMAAVRAAYRDRGFGAGMAAFMVLSNEAGELGEEFLERPAPDPATFGLPAEDDGSREDPLLSERSQPIIDFVPDADALRAAPTRVVLAVGEESRQVLTGRAAVAAAELLGQEATVFPSHHGGFMDGEYGWPGQPDAFAERLREVLDAG
ncbi:alpha/beta fold hydrolase [Desertihabitans aurantiacus]|uniref:alpha/beta fold hydrolase n=1 Tax=Desertihabitans aurantiacus TaxID=2282477 RepID=UPI000DF780F2|nr:alpha/beta hydrolase [Desertihabitans aurantiacus]